MNKIKILHIAEAAGGVDQYLKMLLKYLNKKKFENILICSNDYVNAEYEAIVSDFIQIDICHDINLSKDIKTVREIRKYIKKTAPDIVYSHSSKAGALVRLANIGLNNHSIYNPHGWAFNMNCGKCKKLVYIAIEKFLSLCCDKIVCISEAEKQSALDKKICSERKLKVIFNGIDIEAMSEKNNDSEYSFENPEIPENAFVIGVVGRLAEQKSPDVFVKAAAMIKERIPEAFFIMVGDGDYRTFVEQYSKQHGLENSLFITGWVKNPSDYIELFDVAVLPSRWEGFGLVLAEYMMFNKPIVASNVDAIPNIITDYHNGLLINPDNPEELCEKVTELYKNQELCEKLIQNGSIVVRERFDVKRVASEHEELIEMLCGEKNENR